VTPRELRMQTVYLMREEKTIEVMAGKRDIPKLLPAIWFISCVLLVDEHKMAQA
jgi:hypothetical protein